MDGLLDQLQQVDVISADQRIIVETEQRLRGQSVDTLLLESGFVSPEQLRRHHTGLRSVTLDPEEFVPDDRAVDCLPESFARRHCVLPLSLDPQSRELVVVLSDATDVLLRDRLERLVAPVSVAFRLANTADIFTALNRCYGVCVSLDGILNDIDKGDACHSAAGDSYQVPVVRLVDAILRDAVTQRASDIHLSPEEHYFRIRYRIDGMLVSVRCLHRRYWAAIVVRLKVLSGMDIAESRLPQDGHISRRINGDLIDFRVSSFPVRTGENLVLRVLDKRRGIRRLAELELPAEQLTVLNDLIRKPQGMILVCGPTGSGKTTTLYALLREHDDALNIMTLEDPIEYPMLRIRQTSVGAMHKLDYSSGVRALLRQDPDVLLIGEIRDSDSCAMAFRASMCGHQVLTTVHAPDAIGALIRLAELGAEQSALATAVSGIVAQRLLRRCCPHCDGQLQGCAECNGSGYKGRVVLLETLQITPTLAQEIRQQADGHMLLQCALQEGMRPLRQNASAMVAQGLTNQREVIRVLGPV